MKESDYYCMMCKKEWEDAVQPYCSKCGSPYRTSDYNFKNTETETAKPKEVHKN